MDEVESTEIGQGFPVLIFFVIFYINVLTNVVKYVII